LIHIYLTFNSHSFDFWIHIHLTFDSHSFDF